METYSYNNLNHSFYLPSNINKFFNVAFQITKRCNYNCYLCCESDYCEELSTNEIFKIIDNLSVSGVERICLTGGEPTCRADLFSIIDYIHLNKIIITLATNCSNLDISTINFLKRKISNLRLTIYGTEKTHDNITQIVGSFKSIIKTIEMANSNNIPVYICLPIMQSNFHDLDFVYQFCSSNQIKKIIVFSLINKGYGKQIFNKESIDCKQIQLKINSLKPTLTKVFWTSFTELGQCALILPNGDLVGTPYNENYSMNYIVGNTLKSSLVDLWNKYPFKENYINYYIKK